MEETGSDQELEATFYIQTQTHWKALSHPLRLAIVRLLRQQAMTNEELAHALDVASGQLHFHTKHLLDAGLIRLIGTRQKQAITEKLYRATSKRFRVGALLDSCEDGATEADEVESAIQLYRNTLCEYPTLFSADCCVIDHSLLLLPPHKVGEIQQKLRALIQEAMESKTTAPDAVPMALSVLLYPLPGTITASEEEHPQEEHLKKTTLNRIGKVKNHE